ncbi:MAG: TerB family tellurite resistance protein [Flavobacteriaceae bacterium]|nr:TerB family tellurite resistance protein [Flavobacteriaceae bacterium]
MSFAKWLGASLGWSFGGPIGAILGFALGSAIDGFADFDTKEYRKRIPEGKSRTRPQARPRTKPGDFEVSLLVLAAVVIKADGDINRRELDYVRDQFKQMYGNARANRAFRLFGGIIKKDKISTRQVCMQIRQHMDHASRLQLLHFLFGIARADGNVTEAELQAIHRMAGYLYINDRDYESIKAMFYNEVNAAYKILEVDKNASNDEVKKAYRKMVKKHHPDKVRHLGEEHMKGAEEKFRMIQKAYEQIQKERGL